MGGIYDILESYRQQNDPRFVYEGLYEQPAYTGPNIDPMYNLGARQFGNMNRMDFGVPQQATGIMQQAPLQNLNIDTSYGVANEEDVEQEFLPDQKKSSGLADLFRTLIGFAVPGSSFFLNQGRGAFDGIKSLNQRLRNTDFGQSRTGAEYAMRRRERKQADRAQEAMPGVYRSAREQGFTNDRGGFSTSRADRAGTSLGSGQFSSKRSTGRQGY